MSYLSYDLNSLWRFLVRLHPDGSPVRVNDRLTYSLGDWFPNSPTGGEMRDSVLSEDAMSMVEYSRFSPFFGPFNAQQGDGGDVTIVTSDGWVVIVATQDGGRPGLWYWLGPGIGMPVDGRRGAWVICGPDVKIGFWTSIIAYVGEAQYTPSNIINGVNPAYTRYLIDRISVPFQTRGTSTVQISLECIVSEHYSTGDPTTADGMERFWYAEGIGSIRWEAWNLQGTVEDLSYRAVPIAYGFPSNSPLNSAMKLADVRHYTNRYPLPVGIPHIPARPWSTSQSGWPPNFVLP